MRSSPRKVREEERVTARCLGELPPGLETLGQLARLPIVELRQQAGQLHGLRNAAVLGRQDLVERLAKHFQAAHGLELEGDGGNGVIGDTIDRLRTRIRGRKDVKEESVKDGDTDGVMEDLVMESEEEQVVPLQDEEQMEREYIIERQEESPGEGEAYTVHTQHQFTGEEEVEYEEGQEEPSLANMRYKIGGGEGEDGGQEMVVQVLPKAVSGLSPYSLPPPFTPRSGLSRVRDCTDGEGAARPWPGHAQDPRREPRGGARSKAQDVRAGEGDDPALQRRAQCRFRGQQAGYAQAQHAAAEEGEGGHKGEDAAT
jgi:hypothetical protein